MNHILIFILFTAGIFLVATHLQSSRDASQQRPLAADSNPPPARVPAAAQAADLSDLRARAGLANFLKLESCLEETNPCGFADDHPRALHAEVARRATAELQRLRLRAGALTAEAREQLRRDLEPAARWGLDFLSDSVRAEALELARLSLAPEERASAVIAALRETVNPRLFERGLAILEEIHDTEGALIDDFLADVLTLSAFEPAEVVAKGIGPFLNVDNFARFRDIRRVIPVTSMASLHLRAELQEFERLQARR